MADNDKVVHVPGKGLMSFPGSMSDDSIGSAIVSHLRSLVGMVAPSLTSTAPAAPPAVPAVANRADIPAFMQSKVGQIKQVVESGDPNVNAYVRPTSSTVHVVNPSQFNQGTPQHEYEHVYENAVRPMTQTLLSGGNGAEQDFGGLPGLQSRIAQGQTIANMNPEQRAEMVGQAYNVNQILQKAAAKGVASPAGTAAFDAWQAAAHPFIQQLKNLGDDQIDVHPAAPGLPPASVTGILAPDPLMGGPWTLLPKK